MVKRGDEMNCPADQLTGGGDCRSGLNSPPDQILNPPGLRERHVPRVCDDLAERETIPGLLRAEYDPEINPSVRIPDGEKYCPADFYPSLGDDGNFVHGFLQLAVFRHAKGKMQLFFTTIIFYLSTCISTILLCFVAKSAIIWGDVVI